MMGKKVIINERQYKLILEQMSKNKGNDMLLINEASKELILGAAIILSRAMGKDMSSFNKERAEMSISDPKMMNRIKTTFEDELALKELTSDFEDVGMKNPDALLARNAHAFVDEFNKITADKGMNIKMDVNVINNMKELNPIKKK